MTIAYRGNFIIIRYDPGETTGPIKLADGYSFETISVVGYDNINVIYPEITFTLSNIMRFPPVNSMNPCILWPRIIDNTKRAYLRILILKFGQIPDPKYFERTFIPISVLDDDGNEYKVIPSDQFK